VNTLFYGEKDCIFWTTAQMNPDGIILGPNPTLGGTARPCIVSRFARYRGEQPMRHFQQG